MKPYFIIPCLTIFVLLSGCSVLSTGSRYNAKVVIPNHANAYIFYKGKSYGKGNATIKILRQEANNLSFKIVEENCNTETHSFSQHKFRWGSMALSLVATPVFGITPIPLGIIIDGGTGACWQPDINEKGVTKQDIDNFTYTINYTGCKKSKLISYDK